MIAVDYCKINEKYNQNGKKRKPLSRWAIKIKARDGKCKICGNQNGIQAHHILPKREYPHWKYELMNGIALCINCHEKADDGLITSNQLFEHE